MARIKEEFKISMKNRKCECLTCKRRMPIIIPKGEKYMLRTVYVSPKTIFVGERNYEIPIKGSIKRYHIANAHAIRIAGLT